MKVKTGKPARKKITARHLAVKKRLKNLKIGTLDPAQRYSLREAAMFLRTSLPTLHKFINEGALETFKEGKRRYATGRGIAKLSLPPAEREASAA